MYVEVSKLPDLHPLEPAQTLIHAPGPALCGLGGERTGIPPGCWCVRSSLWRGELDANRNNKGKGRRKTGFPGVGASLPGVGRVTHLGLAASAAQPEASTARSWEPGTLGGLSPVFPICFPSWAETELEAWGWGWGADYSFGGT